MYTFIQMQAPYLCLSPRAQPGCINLQKRIIKKINAEFAIHIVYLVQLSLYTFIWMQASYLCLGFPEPSWVAISLQWWKRDACRKRAFMIELQYFCHLLYLMMEPTVFGLSLSQLLTCQNLQLCLPILFCKKSFIETKRNLF